MGESGQLAVHRGFRRASTASKSATICACWSTASFKTATVAAFLDNRDDAGAMPPNFAVMDIGWAQELFGRQGHLSVAAIAAR